MTEQQILNHITSWQDRMVECERQFGEFVALTGSTPESPLAAAVYGLMGGYTNTVSNLIAYDNYVLEAWWLEHNFGEKPMKIGFHNEPMRSISTIQELASFIAEDLRRAA